MLRPFVLELRRKTAGDGTAGGRDYVGPWHAKLPSMFGFFESSDFGILRLGGRDRPYQVRSRRKLKKKVRRSDRSSTNGGTVSGTGRTTLHRAWVHRRIFPEIMSIPWPFCQERLRGFTPFLRPLRRIIMGAVRFDRVGQGGSEASGADAGFPRRKVKKSFRRLDGERRGFPAREK